MRVVIVATGALADAAVAALSSGLRPLDADWSRDGQRAWPGRRHCALELRMRMAMRGHVEAQAKSRIAYPDCPTPKPAHITNFPVHKRTLLARGLSRPPHWLAVGPHS